MPGGYRVEYAASGRSKCNGKGACKGTPIGKGELRFGTWVTINEHGSFKWRHFGCLTPEVLRNIMKSLEDKPEELDGYEELRPNDQEIVKYALENIEAEEEKKKDEDSKKANKKSKPSKKRKSKSEEEEEEELKEGKENEKNDDRKIKNKKRKSKLEINEDRDDLNKEKSIPTKKRTNKKVPKKKVSELEE